MLKFALCSLDCGMPALLDLETAWYNVKLPLRAAKLSELATFSISKEALDALFAEAQTIVDSETKLALGSKKGWYMNQFQTRGTTADRIAAAAVKLSSSDCMLHLDSFTLLFDVARNDAHHFDSALKALAAVWPKVLPPRPLKRFAAQYFATLPPIEEADKRRKVICFWYIEDVLKRTYSQFLAIMESSLKDNLLVRRQGWIDVAGKLLNAVAESRNIVISMVVDKLGDPIKAMAHQAYHLLLNMLSESSTNQSLLMTELEKLAFQRNCPLAAQKYCINVMNQLVFNKNERKLALKAVISYLALFKQCVVQGNTDQSVTGALIVGLRRAFPFAGADLSTVEPHLDALFVLANTGPFLQRVSTLALIQQLVGKGGLASLENRFYRALYASLLVSPHALPHSSQLTVFFTTLYKAMREDTKVERVAAFTHRLLQRCTVNAEPFVCAALLLVGEISRAVPGIAALLKPRQGSSEYSVAGREPQFAKAQTECLWVLHLLAKHTHPSVVKLAVYLAVGEEAAYDIHPLDDLTLLNFLTMFADVEVDPNESRAVGNKGVPVFRRQIRVAPLPRVSDRTFVEAAPDHVDPAHLFMHRYAHQRERFLARRAEAASSVWDQQAEQEAKQLQSTTDALFGPEINLASAVPVVLEPVPVAQDEDVEDLNWGMDHDDFEDEEEDDADDVDAPDGAGLSEVLQLSSRPKSKREQQNDAWMDQAEHGIARSVNKRSASARPYQPRRAQPNRRF